MQEDSLAPSAAEEPEDVQMGLDSGAGPSSAASSPTPMVVDSGAGHTSAASNAMQAGASGVMGSGPGLSGAALVPPPPRPGLGVSGRVVDLGRGGALNPDIVRLVKPRPPSQPGTIPQIEGVRTFSDDTGAPRAVRPKAPDPSNRRWGVGEHPQEEPPAGEDTTSGEGEPDDEPEGNENEVLLKPASFTC